MAKRKGLLGMSPRRRKASLKMSANKSAKAGYTAPKKRTMNSDAKSMAKATMAGKAPTKSKLSKFGQVKLAAKQKALNLKGQAKALGRKGGSMSAKHRKAISDGLKKRFGRG
jgi:hypothetical protein